MSWALAVVLVTGMIVGITAAGWGISWVTAPFRGAVGAREKIQADPNFRLDAYNSFYNQCASIQALEGDEDSQTTLLSSVTNENDKRILNANIAALEGTRSGAIARYNIESHKQWTVAQFKSRALVYEIPTGSYLTFNSATNVWQKGSKTICVIG